MAVQAYAQKWAIDHGLSSTGPTIYKESIDLVENSTIDLQARGEVLNLDPFGGKFESKETTGITLPTEIEPEKPKPDPEVKLEQELEKNKLKPETGPGLHLDINDP